MGFLVIPGIDVAGGRLARLTPDGPIAVDAFGGDPVAAARAFADAGAAWIHVVDMDLAFLGEPRNLDVVREIASLPVEVQASGGVLAESEAEALLGAGASRVVLGSGMLHARPLLRRLLGELGDRAAVGLEVDGDVVRPRGRVAVELALAPTLAWLADVTPARLVVTAVARVGGLEGPDLETVRVVLEATGRPVIAAAGVSSLNDLRALASTDGVEGAVVGRVLLEGELELDEALALGR